MHNLPKTNIAPENRPSPIESTLPTIHLQVLSWFQEGAQFFDLKIFFDFILAQPSGFHQQFSHGIHGTGIYTYSCHKNEPYM